MVPHDERLRINLRIHFMVTGSKLFVSIFIYLLVTIDSFRGNSLGGDFLKKSRFNVTRVTKVNFVVLTLT